MTGRDPGMLVGRDDRNAELAGNHQKIAHQLLGRLIAAVAVLGEQAADDPRQFDRDGRIDPAISGGGSSWCWSSFWSTSRPGNGGWPVSMWNMVQPSE